jgi:holo-[acyl-carrier protein] synthase
MMIYGIGIDIVQISRIETVIERWGYRFLKRVFTESEIAFCQAKARPAARFALRFAAKEAFAKALGSGFRDGLGFRQIEVQKNPNGRPLLGLYGKSKEVTQNRGITKTHLSLSDDGLYAVAMVLLEQ